jgi:hypothetical protein
MLSMRVAYCLARADCVQPRNLSAIFAALPSIPEDVSISPQGFTCIGGEFSSNRHIFVKIMSNLPFFAQSLTVLNAPARRGKMIQLNCIVGAG